MTKKERRAQVVEESRRTGKSFEDLLAEKSPERYRRMVERQLAEYRNFLTLIAKRADVNAQVDATYKRLAMRIADQIRIDAELEAKWDAIRTNLRAEGAHGTER